MSRGSRGLQTLLIKGAPKGIAPQVDVEDVPSDRLLDALNVDVTEPLGAISRRKTTRRYSSTASPMGNTSYDHTARILRLFWWRRRDGTRWLVAIVKRPAPSAWVKNTAYARGEWVTSAAGDYYECAQAGTSANPGPPAWVTAPLGALTADNTAYWVRRSNALAALYYNNPYVNTTFTKALKNGIAATGDFPCPIDYPGVAVLCDRLFIATGAPDASMNLAFDGTSVNTAYYLAAIGGAAMTVGAAGAGGYITIGSHTWCYTYFNTVTGEESQPSTVSAAVVIAAGNQTVALTGAGLPAGAQYRYRYYRTRAGGTVYNLVAETTTTPYSDTLADESLGYDEPPALTIAPPPTCRFVAAHKSRLIWAGKTDASGTVEPNVVYPSQVLRPLMVDIEESFAVRRDDGDDLTALAVVYETLYAFKRRHVYQLADDSEFIYRAEPVLSDGPVGTISPGTVVSCEGQLLFLSERGLCALNGRQIVPILPDQMRNSPAANYNFVVENPAGVRALCVPTITFTSATGSASYTPYATGNPYPWAVRWAGLLWAGMGWTQVFEQGRSYRIAGGTQGGMAPAWNTLIGSTTLDGLPSPPNPPPLQWLCEKHPADPFSWNGGAWPTGQYTTIDPALPTHYPGSTGAWLDPGEGAVVGFTSEQTGLLAYFVGLGDSVASVTISVEWYDGSGTLLSTTMGTPDNTIDLYFPKGDPHFSASINWSIPGQFWGLYDFPRAEYWCVVAVNGSTYPDTILVYNTRTGSVTRHSCFASAGCMSDQIALGAAADFRCYPMVGDADGVVWQCADDGPAERELGEDYEYSASTGTLAGTGPWTLTRSGGAIFRTGGTNTQGLRGQVVVVKDARGLLYEGIITTNSTTVLTVANWLQGRVPLAGTVSYAVGGMDAHFFGSWLDAGNPALAKQAKQAVLNTERVDGDMYVEVVAAESPDRPGSAAHATWARCSVDFNPSGAGDVRLPLGGCRGRYLALTAGSWGVAGTWRVHSFGLDFFQTTGNR